MAPWITPVAWTSTVPGPWGPIHLAVERARRGRGRVADLCRGVRGGLEADGSTGPSVRGAGGPPTVRRGRSSTGPRGPSRRSSRRRPAGRRAGRPARPPGVGPARCSRPSARSRWGRTAELWRDRPADRPARRGAGGRRGGRAQPDHAPDPVPSGHRRGRDARRVRRRRLGRPRRTARDQTRLCCVREGVTVGRGRGLDSAGATWDRAARPGGWMTAATRPPHPCSRSSAGATSAALAGPAHLDRGLVADRPGRRDLGLSRDRIRAGGRPDPDGDRRPEPHRRACWPASTSTATTASKIMIVTCLIQSVIVGLIARGRRDRASIAWAVRAASCSTPASSSSSIRPTTASSRRWPATRN